MALSASSNVEDVRGYVGKIKDAAQPCVPEDEVLGERVEDYVQTLVVAIHHLPPAWMATAKSKQEAYTSRSACLRRWKPSG